MNENIQEKKASNRGSFLNNLRRVFTGKSNISLIHDRAKSLNKQSFALLGKITQHLDELSKIVNSENMMAKYAKLAELENDFILLRAKIEAINIEIGEIIEIQKKYRYSVIIDDQEYLDDKTNNINEIDVLLEDLIELVKQRPQNYELRGEYLNYLSKKVNLIINDVNSIITDDRQLDLIYSDLTKL